MKNFSDIQSLLDRYWEGETTLEEERALKTYFASGQMDERLRSVAPLFQALREEQNVQYDRKIQATPLKPVMFTWRRMAAAAAVTLLLSAGAWWWTSNQKPVNEQIVRRLPEPSAQPVEQQQQPAPEKNVAATEGSPSPVRVKKTLQHREKAVAHKPDTEAELAMEEIKAALALVSSKIRKSKQEAAKGAVHLENVDKIFKKKSEG